MSQANGASMNVDLLSVDVQHFNVGQYDNAEGLVDLPKSNVVSANLSAINNELVGTIALLEVTESAYSRSLKGNGYSKAGSNWEVNGISSSIGKADDFRKRIAIQSLSCLGCGQYTSCRSITQYRRITSS